MLHMTRVNYYASLTTRENMEPQTRKYTVDDVACMAQELAWSTRQRKAQNG